MTEFKFLRKQDAEFPVLWKDRVLVEIAYQLKRIADNLRR